MKDFKDKVVVVTGAAGSGIGFHLAKNLGLEGAKVVLADIREDQLQKSEKELNELGITAASFVCDISKRQQVFQLADFAWNKFGHVDVIINNAGVSSGRSSVIDFSEEAIERTLSVNLIGVWNGVSVFGKRFIQQGTPAAIYNVGSENSFYNAVPLASPYVASKHAVLALTDALRREVPEFIDVALIIPGFVRSEIGEKEVMKHGMDTDEFAKNVISQLKQDNRFYVVTHAYNIVYIDKRYNEIKESYAKNAPRHEGDDIYDVETLIAKRLAAQTKL